MASKTELTAVKNKIPDISSLVRKTDYAAKITKAKNDYVTTAALDARQKDLTQKATFESEFKKTDDKVGKDTSDILSYESRLNQKEDITNGLERDTSYFRGKDQFDDDGMQNCFVFQPVYNYFKRVIHSTVNNIVYVHYWQPKGLSDGKINAPCT